MSRWLILETSGRQAEAALAEGESVTAERLPEARRHARDLTAALGRLLAGRGWRPSDVTHVAVSAGPGSYTGLRVGVMAAKTFAYAAGCALVAVETFAAVADQLPAEAGEADVLADAQQERVYAQSYRRGNGGLWEAASPLRIVSLSEWAAGRRPGAWLTGPGVGVYDGRLPADAPRAPEADRSARAASVYRRALTSPPADLWALEPLYLRGSYAEEPRA